MPVVSPNSENKLNTEDVADLPFHRSEPVHLRHVLSHTQWLQSAVSQTGRTSYGNIFDTSTTGLANGHIGARVMALKPNKSVSFANVENIISKSFILLSLCAEPVGLFLFASANISYLDISAWTSITHFVMGYFGKLISYAPFLYMTIDIYCSLCGYSSWDGN